MESFSFFLKNERSRSYDRIAFFIVIINLAAFTYLALSSDLQYIQNKAIGGLIFIVVGLTLALIFKKKWRERDISFRWIIDFGITMAWINMEYWIFAGINAILGILYFIARREKNVIVGKHYILYPSLPGQRNSSSVERNWSSVFQKHIRWDELSKVILKDGLLTIDFKNNKLIQQVVDENKTKVDEREFNEFCQQHLTAKAPGREGTQG